MIDDFKVNNQIKIKINLRLFTRSKDCLHDVRRRSNRRAPSREVQRVSSQFIIAPSRHRSVVRVVRSRAC